MSLTDNIIASMMGIGVLTVREVKDGKLTFNINYKLLQENFPEWMEYFIIQNLTSDALSLYHQGYWAYIVMDDGSLQWKPTMKLRRML